MIKFKPFLILTILIFGALNCTAADDKRQEKNIIIQKVGNGITLGLVITNLDDEDKKELKVSEGAKILHVLEESNAEKAGLKENDVVVDFEGEKIEDAKELNDLVEAIEGEKNVSMAVMRDGTKKNIKATIKPDEDEKHVNLKIKGESEGNIWSWNTSESDGEDENELVWIGEDDGDHKVIVKEFVGAPGAHAISIGSNSKGGFLGVVTDNISEKMLEYFEVDHGVLIEDIVEDSPAEKAGLKAGDVITFIQGRKIEDYSDLTRTISFYNPDEEVEVDFVRKGSKKSADIKLAKKKNRMTVLDSKDGNSFFFDSDNHDFRTPRFNAKMKGKHINIEKLGRGKTKMNIYII